MFVSSLYICKELARTHDVPTSYRAVSCVTVSWWSSGLFFVFRVSGSMSTGLIRPQPERARQRLSQRAVWRWALGSVPKALVHGSVEGTGQVPAMPSECPRPGPAEPKVGSLAETSCVKGQDLMEERVSGPAAPLGSERLASILDVLDVTTFS